MSIVYKEVPPLVITKDTTNEEIETYSKAWDDAYEENKLIYQTFKQKVIDGAVEIKAALDFLRSNIDVDNFSIVEDSGRDGWSNYDSYDFDEFEKCYWVGLFKISFWERVWRPYYDDIFGRYEICGYDTYVNGYKNNLEDFVIKWPHIEDYFKYAEKIQKEIEERVYKENKRIDDKRGLTKNLS